MCVINLCLKSWKTSEHIWDISIDYGLIHLIVLIFWFVEIVIEQLRVDIRLFDISLLVCYRFYFYVYFLFSINHKSTSNCLIFNNYSSTQLQRKFCAIGLWQLFAGFTMTAAFQIEHVTQVVPYELSQVRSGIKNFEQGDFLNTLSMLGCKQRMGWCLVKSVSYIFENVFKLF